MWQTLFTIATVGCVLLLCTAVWLWTQRHALRQQVAELRRELAESELQVDSLRDTLSQRDVEIVKARTQLDGLDDKFKALAADALEQNSKQVLKPIELLIKPISESLDKQEKAIQSLETKREGAYKALEQHLKTMVEDQKALQGETANLVKALRRPEVRGKWGQMQLRRVAELAGMIDHCDFTEEQAVDGGSQRPDMVVHLPADREIVIDAKTPIDAYISAIEAEDESIREQHLNRHVEQIEAQVKSLSVKKYFDQFERSPAFVVMFIPGEVFLQPAAIRKPKLIEEAMEKNVIIATPTMLVALLKAVALGWREEKVAESAQEIKELGRLLHDQIGTIVDRLAKHQRSLGSAFGTFNELLTAVEGRLVSRARKFDDLGAGSSKALPEVPQIEIPPREVRQPVSE